MRKASTTNSAQRAYMLAKAHLQALRNQEAEIERAYIVAHGIHNGCLLYTSPSPRDS